MHATWLTEREHRPAVAARPLAVGQPGWMEAFMATGYWQCRACFHMWQPDDAHGVTGADGDEHLECDRCGRQAPAWQAPVF